MKKPISRGWVLCWYLPCCCGVPPQRPAKSTTFHLHLRRVQLGAVPAAPCGGHRAGPEHQEVYTSLLVGIATGALLYANGNLELALTTLFFNEDGGMVSKLSDPSNVGILVFLVMLGILVA